MDLTLLKVHGSMNTFYLVEGPERDDYNELALRLTALDSEADGLLVVLPSLQADAKMRVFNRDGSEASMCGNGLRCVARFVCERQGIEEAVIETMKALLKVKKEKTLQDGIARYSVEISPVSFKLKDLPMVYEDNDEWLLKPLPFLSDDIVFSAVAVPNPHLIGLVPAAYQNDQSHQQKWAEFFNGPNDYFSDGVNVSYVTKVEEGIFVRTFERGVGFTNACGTAMTASALISCMAGLVPFGNVNVYNPGGMVQCQVEKKGEEIRLLLTGNATVLSVHRFQWENEVEDSGFKSVTELEEQVLYEKFIEQTSSISDQFAQ
ncbi:diaminopimelate epimerase [Planococcus sp. N028]|uniref:Diaminopimelate epimerase n=1 Tax=Planococcus shixiaomingii TaxID=3058393 RepID=A0ABT8MZF1_9BACL|nr:MULTISPECIES: diaminopimelate epimerase [unclassified Planococcus (in: firmicutes)]MDN7241022.1 diaminopimelate epimerase [Planococcus sp. N028]WKA53276.1 diaminopimelate epimerase [Planococcus sp. N022]